MDEVPFFLVECKSSGKAPLNANLAFFQQRLGAQYAFQVAIDEPASEILPTDYTTPVKISAADLFKILP